MFHIYEHFAVHGTHTHIDYLPLLDELHAIKAGNQYELHAINVGNQYEYEYPSSQRLTAKPNFHKSVGYQLSADIKCSERPIRRRN